MKRTRFAKAGEAVLSNEKQNHFNFSPEIGIKTKLYNNTSPTASRIMKQI